MRFLTPSGFEMTTRETPLSHCVRHLPYKGRRDLPPFKRAGAVQQKRPVGQSQQGVNLRGTTCFHAPISRTWYAPYSSLTRKTASLEVLFGETARGGIPQLFPSALSAKGTALCAGMPVASLPLQRLFLFIIAVFGGMSNDFRGILSLSMTKKVPHLSHAHA